MFEKTEVAEILADCIVDEVMVLLRMAAALKNILCELNQDKPSG